MVDPDVLREMMLVPVAGRRLSLAVATFVRAIKPRRWPSAQV